MFDEKSTLSTKFVSLNLLNRVQQKEKADSSVIYFGDHEPVKEYQYGKDTLTLFAASPLRISEKCKSAFMVKNPHLNCKPLRVLVRPEKYISVDIWSEDNLNGKMFSTLKRWKWGNLSKPRKGFAVAVMKSTVGNREKYRFKIKCHAEPNESVSPVTEPEPKVERKVSTRKAKPMYFELTKRKLMLEREHSMGHSSECTSSAAIKSNGDCKVGNEPIDIVISEPSQLQQITRQPALMKVIAPKLKVKWGGKSDQFIVQMESMRSEINTIKCRILSFPYIVSELKEDLHVLDFSSSSYYNLFCPPFLQIIYD